MNTKNNINYTERNDLYLKIKFLCDNVDQYLNLNFVQLVQKVKIDGIEWVPDKYDKETFDDSENGYICMFAYLDTETLPLHAIKDRLFAKLKFLDIFFTEKQLNNSRIVVLVFPQDKNPRHQLYQRRQQILDNDQFNNSDDPLNEQIQQFEYLKKIKLLEQQLTDKNNELHQIQEDIKKQETLFLTQKQNMLDQVISLENKNTSTFDQYEQLEQELYEQDTEIQQVRDQYMEYKENVIELEKQREHNFQMILKERQQMLEELSQEKRRLEIQLEEAKKQQNSMLHKFQQKQERIKRLKEENEQDTSQISSKHQKDFEDIYESYTKKKQKFDEKKQNNQKTINQLKVGLQKCQQKIQNRQFQNNNQKSSNNLFQKRKKPEDGHEQNQPQMQMNKDNNQF